jgi:hypothetical protein
MTYQSGSLGKIQKGDINGFLNTNTPNFNGLWSTGSGDSGYGQTAISAVATGDKIKTTTWKNLIDYITKMANHQGSTITSMSNTLAPTVPATGKTIRIIADNINTVITNNLTTLTTNRLNSAVLNRSTNSTTKTHGSTWSNSLTATFTITFPSHDAARYYFNAGGQIGIQGSHPYVAGYNINGLISEICNDIGTIWMSSPTSGTVSIEGSNWHGIEQKSSTGAGSSVNISTNHGFYAWTNTSTPVITQKGSTSFVGSWTGTNYTSGTYGQVSVKYDGAGVVTVTYLLDEVPDGSAAAANTSVTLILKQPTTTYLTNSWGVIGSTLTVSGSIAAT